MLRASCLASILAAARGFGSTPHAVENACRNKETPVAVSHAEMIADCVAAGIPEMECTAELAEMQTADSVGCGPEPERTSRTSINTAPTALCHTLQHLKRMKSINIQARKTNGHRFL